MSNLCTPHGRENGQSWQVKICGNHSSHDVDVLRQVLDDIDYAGFIFTPHSPRFVSAEQVSVWLNEIPRLRAKAVGVFLNQSAEDILQVISATGIRIVQLHGEEPPELCQELKHNQDVYIWKVMHLQARSGQDQVDQENQIDQENQVDQAGASNLLSEYGTGALPPYIQQFVNDYAGCVDAILLDTKVPGKYGGTGQSFDWSVISRLKKIFAPLPLFVAGGIRPDNVHELLTTAADGIDVASGVEIQSSTDLRKDVHKIKQVLHVLTPNKSKGD